MTKICLTFQEGFQNFSQDEAQIPEPQFHRLHRCSLSLLNPPLPFFFCFLVPDLNSMLHAAPELCTMNGLKWKASFSGVTAVFPVKVLQCSWVLFYSLLSYSLESDTGSGNKVPGEDNILPRSFPIFLLCIYKECFRHETLTPTLICPFIISLVSSCSKPQENSPSLSELGKR